LLELKTEWLDAKSLVSRALSDPRTRDFFLDAASDTGKRTGCRLTVLYCSDDLVAANLNFTAKGRSAVHVTTYKLCHEKLRPGHLLTYADLERCKEDGIDIYDFMGLLARFKLDWPNNTVEVNDWAVPLTRKGWL